MLAIAASLVDATARVARFRLIEAGCGPSHGSILLRARNAYGGSIFAIVESAQVLWVPPDVDLLSRCCCNGEAGPASHPRR